jgi:hypothetical protein
MWLRTYQNTAAHAADAISAVLRGCEVYVPTPDGNAEIKIGSVEVLDCDPDEEE